MKRAQIEEVFRRFAEANPDPMGELEFISPFTLLIAVVLSAQATDASVNKATPALFKAADTPQKMLALGEDGVKRFIQTIGLYNMKARNVIALCRLLVEQHGGKVPSDRETLQTLPGVGRKTASVVLNTAFGQPTIAVDTHVYRVSDRTGLARGKTREEVSETLERIVPERYKMGAHHWLILHGRYVCTARKPNCPACIINDLCAYPAKTTLSGETPRRRATTSVSTEGEGRVGRTTAAAGKQAPARRLRRQPPPQGGRVR
jgi:endonuclease-3